MEGLDDVLRSEAGESAETDRVIGVVMKAIEEDVRRMARAIVSKRDDELLGPGEFDLRDRVLEAACHVLEAAINDRKKRAIEAAACVALGVAATRGSSSGGRKKSSALSARFE
jgi:hypothetical protein